MAKKITRTIKSANVTYQYYDIDNEQIKEDVIMVTENINSPIKLLRDLKRKLNSSIKEVVKITNIDIITNKYEMKEEDFIKLAWIVDSKED